MRRELQGLAAAALLAAVPQLVEAQDRWDSPRAFLDIAGIGAEPVGEFANNIEDGWGIAIGGRFPIDLAGVVSMRVDMGFINYGHERLYGCSFTCRVGFDVNTNNNILFAGVGPELAAPMGPVRPYVGLVGGVGYFVTTSSMSGSDDWHHFANSTNYDDVVMQRRGRGGLQLRLAGGRTPVYLDVGGEYHANGIAEYLGEGDIEDHPDGSITIFPRRTEANLWTFRLGVSIGLRGEDDKPRRRGRRGR